MCPKTKWPVLIVLLAIFASGAHAAPPTAETNTQFTFLSSSQVLVRGFVDPNGLSTTIIFEYGTTTNYGDEVPAFGSPTAADSGIRTTWGVISNLTAGATYNYRLSAENADGTTNGGNVTVTMPLSNTLPNVISGGVVGITSTSAVVIAEVNYSGTSPVNNKGACYSTSPNPDLSDDCFEIPNSPSLGVFNSPLTDLAQDTFYYTRPFATNAQGTSYGIQLTFRTLLQFAYVGPPGCYGNAPCYTSVQAAVTAVSDGTDILIPADGLVDFSNEDVLMTIDKDIKLFGGWNEGYNRPNSGVTTIQSLTIEKGSINTDTIVLKEP